MWNNHGCLCYYAMIVPYQCISSSDPVYKTDKWPLLLKCFHSNLSMDKKLHPYILWDEITNTFPKFNGVLVEVWEGISNVIPHFTVHVITYSSEIKIEPSWQKRLSTWKIKSKRKGWNWMHVRAIKIAIILNHTIWRDNIRGQFYVFFHCLVFAEDIFTLPTLMGKLIRSLELKSREINLRYTTLLVVASLFN